MKNTKLIKQEKKFPMTHNNQNTKCTEQKMDIKNFKGKKITSYIIYHKDTGYSRLGLHHSTTMTSIILVPSPWPLFSKPATLEFMSAEKIRDAVQSVIYSKEPKNQQSFDLNFKERKTTTNCNQTPEALPPKA